MSIADYLWRYPSALMAWRNLGRNRTRTVLAALGIVIGVISIASLGMAGAALQQQATSDLGSIGGDVTIASGADSATDGVTRAQVETLRDIVSDAEVVPQKSNSTALTARNGEEARMSVTGVTNAAALYNLTNGDAPNRLASGALISNGTAETLDLELGDPVEYDGQIYRISGFLEESGGFGGGGGQLVLPMSALSEQDGYDTVTVVAGNSDAAAALADVIDAQFNGEDDEELRVSTFGSLDSLETFLNTLNYALLAIGAISLVVASVAILNVMLMSTVERRGEIGVLRAVGIRRGEVLRMILTEAALMGAVGGLIGALGSLLVGLAMFQLLTGNAMAVFNWSSSQYLLFGFAFAVVASVLSGVYPAWKAANDRPVDALRS
ncbi:ABC transporter permease [Haloferax sp. Atlit-6N]|uniref:ABC transporter permease n=1 Tax=Haloferax gibbonsii (strain ATCC 33959 / DSM 4427 / JCM 8863 / NBRC 102184 / NCIMB 2188 / Ma 2.38) TaxID=1227459 RepID=M0H627_HALGM|nr:MULTISPECIES: ABC transporter permease [Haloferax]ELZ79971.1 ABC transporter permease [Haloferax gibbonsii ATCC 33959]REA02069.1 ABC transporter permease [Haloferax sp. Atlit-6N]